MGRHRPLIGSATLRDTACCDDSHRILVKQQSATRNSQRQSTTTGESIKSHTDAFIWDEHSRPRLVLVTIVASSLLKRTADWIHLNISHIKESCREKAFQYHEPPTRTHVLCHDLECCFEMVLLDRAQPPGVPSPLEE